MKWSVSDVSTSRKSAVSSDRKYPLPWNACCKARSLIPSTRKRSRRFSPAPPAAEGRIPAYGGGLFHPHREADCEFPELDDLRLGDQTVAHVLEALTHVQTKRGKVTLSYRELDVEQLGSLYEGLLERTVD
jgi:hypothetical protein